MGSLPQHVITISDSLPAVPSPRDQPNVGVDQIKRPYTSLYIVRKNIGLVLWVLLQFALFFYNWAQYRYSPQFSVVYSVLNESLPVARGAALCLTFDCAFMLLSMSKLFLTKLRQVRWIKRWLLVDDAIEFHKLNGYTISFFTIIHVCAHIVNHQRLLAKQVATRGGIPNYPKTRAELVAHPTTVTGIVTLLALIFIVGTAATRKIRAKNFELFFYTHHLYIVFFFALFIHGAFCFIRANSEPFCSVGGLFWRFALVPTLIYVAERLLRMYYSSKRLVLKRAVVHTDTVLELVFKKPSYLQNGQVWSQKAGQYIRLNCPEASLLQWHPFTVASPPESKTLSVFIHMQGDWTRRLKQTLIQATKEKRQLAFHLDGPFGTPTEDVFDYEVAMVVGAGIGVTPFASIVESLKYRFQSGTGLNKLKKLHFIWMCRKPEDFQWFRHMLDQVKLLDKENVVSIELYLTKTNFRLKSIYNIIQADIVSDIDPVTHMKDRTMYGRPNFDALMDRIKGTYVNTTIGVFCCGPPVLANKLGQLSYKKSRGGIGTIFEFNQERF